MKVENQIKINNIEYIILDAKEKITVPDCLVLTNKIGIGHGEAKLYVGQRNDLNFSFFDDFDRNCFFITSDLKEYLLSVKEEYFDPQQPYLKKELLPNFWKEYFSELNNLNEIEYFNLTFLKNLKPPRMYLNSNDNIYKFFRKIALPNITYLSVLKLKNKITHEIVYYFKLFVDYFGEVENPKFIKKQEDIIENSNIKEVEKSAIIQSRIGQGLYREKLFKECPFCPITLVSDDRLLIASHIKPWSKSDNKEKIDPKNGFLFTPNIDRLFDRGFITFTDDKVMLVSPWLSKMTVSQLNITPNKKYFQLIIDGKERYLKYHRENIFKK